MYILIIMKNIWMFLKTGGVSTQIIHKIIGFFIIFTIHFGVPLFLETAKKKIYPPSYQQLSRWKDASFLKATIRKKFLAFFWIYSWEPTVPPPKATPPKK